MSIGSMINRFLSPEDAYKDAENVSNQQWQQTQGYAKPWIDQGNSQYGRLNTATGDLLDPTGMENRWSSSYETSPYAQQMLKENQGAGLDAASSMGLMGSSAAVNNIQTGAHNIVNQDRQQYMNDLMQKYMAGIGLGQNMYGTGANIAGTMAGLSNQHGDTMAGLKYGESAAPGAMFGKLAGMGIDMGLNYATGGTYGMAKAANNMMGGAGSGAGYSG